MCGIIGITSSKPVSSSILHSLKKLEYRGYDSAGIATIKKDLIDKDLSESTSIILWKGLIFCLILIENVLDFINLTISQSLVQNIEKPLLNFLIILEMFLQL